MALSANPGQQKHSRHMQQHRPSPSQHTQLSRHSEHGEKPWQQWYWFQSLSMISRRRHQEVQNVHEKVVKRQQQGDLQQELAMFTWKRC